MRVTPGLIALVFLSACSSPKGRNSGAVSDSSNSVPAAGKRLPGFETFDTVLSFAGLYVNQAYVDSIHRNRAPRLDQNVSPSCVSIPERTLQESMLILGFHEGTPGLVVKDGSVYRYYDPQFDPPGELIEQLSPDRIRIGDQYYQKLKHPDTAKYDWGILEELLYSGKYQNEKGDEITFGVDGQIKGLDTNSYYYPVADYVGTPDIGADRIMIGRSPKNVSDYACRFAGDTLLIYRVGHEDTDTSNADSGKDTLGELHWKLRRVP